MATRVTAAHAMIAGDMSNMSLTLRLIRARPVGPVGANETGFSAVLLS